MALNKIERRKRIHYRIRKHGGKILLASDIKLSYYCRDTIKGIMRMAFQNLLYPYRDPNKMF